MPKVALYARVSTRGQSVENQVAELKGVGARAGWQIVGVFCDQGISGAKGREGRKGLNDLLKAVLRRDVDQVCVWSIDRLGRSLQDLIGVLDELRQSGCSLYVHKQAIDTNTPSGKMLFQLLGVFAEFEREIMRERIIAGQQRARAQGKRIGRKSVIDADLSIRARWLKDQGLSVRAVAQTMGIGVGTAWKALAQARSENVAARPAPTP